MVNRMLRKKSNLFHREFNQSVSQQRREEVRTRSRIGRESREGATTNHCAQSVSDESRDSECRSWDVPYYDESVEEVGTFRLGGTKTDEGIER